MISICAKTNLATIEEPVTAFRVAKESYGPFKPLERLDGHDRAAWYRFDTPGRTIYTAEDRETAFLEALSWARLTADFTSSLKKTADHFGVPVEEIRAEVEEEWGRLWGMVPGWIPVTWRDDRKVYTVTFEPGRWVDIAHGNTIATLASVLEEELLALGVTETLTLSEVTGGNREITTLISTWVREQVLDDGSYPLGIRFPSKHGATGQGHGHCWAFWLRRTDVGLTDEPVKAVREDSIGLGDTAFQRALNRHGIQSR